MKKTETLLPQTPKERQLGHFRTSGGYTIHVQMNFEEASRHYKKNKAFPWKLKYNVGQARIYPPGLRSSQFGELRKIGSVIIQTDNQRNMNGEDLRINEPHRGKGLASAMYDAIEIHTKTKMVPAIQQLQGGAKFWEKRANLNFVNVGDGSRLYKTTTPLKSFAEFMRECFAANKIPV